LGWRGAQREGRKKKRIKRIIFQTEGSEKPVLELTVNTQASSEVGCGTCWCACVQFLGVTSPQSYVFRKNFEFSCADS
jgi:hypothetical protein